MASFMQELHAFVNAAPWSPGNIQFDVHPKTKDYPYFTMLSINDEGETGEFCAEDSGRTVVQFNGYGTDRYTLFDQMDQLKKNIKKARNSLPTYSLWYLRPTGVVGYGTEDLRIYRFTFELQTEWRLL